MSDTAERQISWSVFAKPWARLPAARLADVVTAIGADAVELPVRANCAVTPEDAPTTLPAYAAALGDQGIGIVSVAGEPSEPVFAACADAGVPMIRVMVPVDGSGYRASVGRFRDELERAAPLVERYGVGVGVQPHHGPYVTTAIAVHGLLAGLPSAFTVIWDAAHEALAGQDPVVTLDAVADRLSLVNLKNAVYRPSVPEPGAAAAPARWRSWFVTGPEGMSDWAAIIAHLVRRGYRGSLCLSAQYSEIDDTIEAMATSDLAFAKTVLASVAVSS